MPSDNLIHGVLTTGLDDLGFVQSISWSGESDEDTAKDKSGITRYHKNFDARVGASATVRFKRTATLPVTDDTVTLSDTPSSEYDGVYFILQPPNVEESNEAGVTITIEMRRYLAGNTPPNTVVSG